MNPDFVLRQLELAVLGPQAAQEESMRTLQQCESQPLFVPSLVYILRSDGISSNTRMLAVICLKNVVHRHWVTRGHSGYTVSVEEKAMLREYLIDMSLSETAPLVSVQLSVLLSKVARQDWPNDWPSVLERLFSAIQSNLSWTVQKNAMVALMRSLSELSSKKILVAKQMFSAASVSMLPPMGAVWKELSTKLKLSIEKSSTFQNSESALEINELCNHLTTCAKILSILIIKCFSKASQDSYIPFIFEMLVADMEYFATTLRSNAVATCSMAAELRVEDCIDDNSDDDGGAGSDDSDDEGGARINIGSSDSGRKHKFATLSFICGLRHLLRKLSTIPVRLQKLYPVEMIPFLSPFLAFYFRQLLTSYGDLPTLDLTNTSALDRSTMSPMKFCELHGLVIQAVLFLSNVFSCRIYCTKSTLSSPRSEANAAAATADSTINSFLLSPVTSPTDSSRSASCADKIILLLFSSLLSLTNREISEWSGDPESLLLAEEGEKENDSVRTAAQGLFYGIIERSAAATKSALRSILIQLGPNPQLPFGEGMKSTLHWESVFLAAGLSGDKLFPNSFQDFSESNDGDVSPSKHVAIKDLSLSYPDEWVETILLPLIQRFIKQHEEACVAERSPSRAPPQLLLRRLLWLLNCWMYLISAENSELLSKILLTLIYVIEPHSYSLETSGGPPIDVSSDLVTAMQAAVTIQTLFNSDVLDAAFVESHFSRICSALCLLTTRFSEHELSAKIVCIISDVLSSLCGRVVVTASPGFVRLRDAGLIFPLASQLFTLWQSSDENSPLRSELIDVFTKLIKCAGGSSKHESPIGNLFAEIPRSLTVSRECSCCSDAEVMCSVVHDMALRVVAFSASGTANVSHLTSSAINLWLQIMRNSRRYTAGMDLTFNSCIPRLFSAQRTVPGAEPDEFSPMDIMDMMSSDIQNVFHLIESYVIVYTFLCPLGSGESGIIPFTTRYDGVLTAVYQRVLGEIRPQAVSLVVRPLEILLITSPQEAVSFLVRSEILHFLLKVCLGSTLSTSSDSIKPISAAYASLGESDIAVVSYLHVIARVMLIAMPACIHVLSSLTDPLSQPAHHGLEIILLHLLEKFDSVGYDNMVAGGWRKRLWCFAALSIYPCPQFRNLYALIPEVTGMVDGMMYVDPYSKLSRSDPSWGDLVDNLSKNALKVSSNGEDEDDDRAVSEDGDEYDFDSAIGGRGSQPPVNTSGSKSIERESILVLFERVLSGDSVLGLPLDVYCGERVSLIRASISEEEATTIFQV